MDLEIKTNLKNKKSTSIKEEIEINSCKNIGKKT